MLLAGDIYDGPERGLRAQLRFRDGLERLAAAGIASFVVHGNHDPVEQGWSALSGRWPDGVTVFGSSEVGAVTVERDGTALATVQGISYAQRREQRNLATQFRPHAGPGLNVGLLHCNVQGAATGYDDYSPCTLEDLTAAGVDYWALGHVHTRMVLSGRPGGSEPFVVYPGNLQARSPKGSEQGPKGATVVDVAGGRVERVEAVACDRVRFGTVEVDVAGIADVAELRVELVEQAAAALAAADGRSIVVRGARCRGAGPSPTRFADPEPCPTCSSPCERTSRRSSPFAGGTGSTTPPHPTSTSRRCARAATSRATWSRSRTTSP